MDIVHWVFVFTSSLLEIKQIMPSGIYFSRTAGPQFFDFRVKNPHPKFSGNRMDQQRLKPLPIRLLLEKS